MFKNEFYYLSALFTVCLSFVTPFAHGQALAQNQLPSCPKHTGAKFHKCFGDYTYLDGAHYIGDWRDNRWHGFGKLTSTNGDGYVGEFNSFNRHGKGILTTADGKRLEGIWENDKLIRKFKVNLNTESLARVFGGVVVNDTVADSQPINPNRLAACPKPDHSKKIDVERFAKWTNCWGRYKIEFDSTHLGSVFEGEWLNGLPHGKGAVTHVNGDKYIGTYKNGNRHGQATYIYADGDRYVGEYRNGEKHGQGTYTYADGEKYVGEYRDGKKHGQGTYTFFQGDIYIGEWLDDKQHGKGKEIYSDGRQPNEGIFENGKFVRAEKVTLPNINDNFAEHTDRTEIDRERQQLAEERRQVEADKRQREQQRSRKRLNLTISNTQPASDGSFTINVQINADTSSLKINGEEQGGRADGNYVIKKFARAGSVTEFTIVAKDVNGNQDSKTITVQRALSEGSVKIAALNPTQVKKQPERDAVAIIIGIAEYKNLPKAEYANEDARIFYDYAMRALGIKPENIKLLVDADADQADIYQAFKTWLPSRVRSTTDVYVYYSGHGLPASNGQEFYLLPQRAHRDLVEETAISQSKINAAIQATKPRSVTVFLDSCYSGMARTGETLLASARPLALKTDKKLFPAEFTVIAASQADQISSSSPDLKHGIFSYYLMKGMEGDADADSDGKITLGEMQRYLVDNVGRQAGMMNRKQEPQLIGDTNRVLIGR